MESFLNFLWVLIAAVALGFWRMRWQPEQREARRDPLREWTAIGCALVLLFFAVSLTDDLHSEIVLFDESSTGRRFTACAHSSPQAGGNVPQSGPAILPFDPSFQRLRQVGIAIPEEFFQRADFSVEVRAGRAPPSNSL
jgi:hypothetical protein